MVEGNQRIITANGIPTHRVGRFPNKGNPNRIAEQQVLLRIPVFPILPDSSGNASLWLRSERGAL